MNDDSIDYTPAKEVGIAFKKFVDPEIVIWENEYPEYPEYAKELVSRWIEEFYQEYRNTHLKGGDNMVLVAALLGNHIADRLDQFWDYENGWDQGSGKALSVESVDTFIKLIARIDYQNLVALNIAIFMSSEGNIVLNCYVNNTFKELEIVNDNEIRYFSEGGGIGDVEVIHDLDATISNVFGEHYE